jgi:hypothetical protein
MLITSAKLVVALMQNFDNKKEGPKALSVSNQYN